ncbi:MAG: hypothetical protein MAG794_00456 [Gammaproteobacteria bacterium]|nr:hypothetical protein [Gammaproteobacteria bacterium]
MTEHIHYYVDQLLLERGEYLPLELLLREGCLAFADYEAWRNGELDFLDRALFGDPERIRQQLLEAEDYLQRRGWQAESIAYTTWSDVDPPTAVQAASAPLRFSANEAFERCFLRRYRKPRDQPQMDLFTDAPATNLANAIVLALAERNPVEARHGLERLYDTAPDHARLGELERLVKAVEVLDTPVDDVADELRNLQQWLTPLAESLLGKNSRNLLIPLWRRLSAALHGRSYRASHPDLHLSYTANRAMDWGTVRRAVEREADWRADSVLLRRHAQACDHLHQRAAALQSWFELCWRFPEQSDALETSGDQELGRQWVSFLELDPELPTQSFPAWLLLNKPGLTRILPKPAGSGMVCPASYRTVDRIQRDHVRTQVERGNENTKAGQERAMALRARLKRQEPVLFRYFLDSVGPTA